MKKYFIEFENIEAGNKIIYMVFCAEDLNDLEHERDYNTEYLTKLELNYQAGYKATGDVYEIDDETDYDDGISELPEGAEKVDFNPLPFASVSKQAVLDIFGENATCNIDEAWVEAPRGQYQIVSEHDSFFDEEDNPGHSEHTNFDGSPMSSFSYDNETWYFVKQ